MILIFPFCIIALLVGLGLYLRFAPKRISERMKFELPAAIGFIGGIAFVSWEAYRSMSETVDSAWWPIAAFIQSFAFAIIYLIVASVLRWGIYSRSRKERPNQAELDNA
jgi:hypothetical protein